MPNGPLTVMARPRWRWALLIVAVVAIVYGRTASFGFVVFDDESHIVANPYLHPFTSQSLAAFWARPYLNLYIPATYTGWGVLSLMATRPGPGGAATLDPATFHLANVAFHAANAVLVWLILRGLTRTEPAAVLGALAFALHPVQAEPVAWVSGFKDTFSGFWALSSIALLLRAERRGNGWLFAVATVLYGVALCAKPACVVVPPIGAVLIWAGRGRPSRRAVVTLAAWVAMAVACTWVTHHQQGDAAVMTWDPPAVRPLVAADAVAFYLRQLAWPARLVVDYGRKPLWVWQHLRSSVIGILATGLAVGAVVWVARRRGARRVVPAALAVFLCAVGPVLGLVPFIYQQFSTVSDRYLYLSMLGVALLVAWVVDAGGKRAWPVVAVVVVIWAGFAVAQVGLWRDSTTLFQHNVAVNPDSGIAWSCLGIAAERAGDWPAAERYHKRSADCEPDEPRYEAAIVRVLRRAPDRQAEVQVHYARSLAAAARRVLRVMPDAPLAHRSLAQAYDLQGRPTDAAAERALADRLQAAGHVDPTVPQSHW